MGEKIFVVTHEDRTGDGENIVDVMGVFTTREKAQAAILDWVFESGPSDGEMLEGSESLPFDNGWAYITSKSFWKMEEFDVDTVY